MFADLSLSMITQTVVDECNELFGDVRRVTSYKRLDFGVDPDHDADQGIL